MIGALPFLHAISPIPATSLPPLTRFYSSYFNGAKLLQASPCRVVVFRRAGPVEGTLEVENGADSATGLPELGVNGFPALEGESEWYGGKEGEEPLDFEGKKKKSVDREVSNYDRFKMNNGREVFEEKAYLVGVEYKGSEEDNFTVEESLKELEQLADTAGLHVVGSTSQKLAALNPKTYIGSGKVAEIKTAIHALDVETIIFDNELSAGQLRNLEKAFGGNVRVCDRTALILDIFNQRAATHEATLQVTLSSVIVIVFEPHERAPEKEDKHTWNLDDFYHSEKPFLSLYNME
ncbi:hypothetical protein HPP92_013173 [Vanilla planifolia]|uniref:GTPase HflX N-terminal domain-containing protein n=1 Tax=Vanilla planifolia TaxID=51239 RepID=A0A835UW80_VANPL|nr:hypothetical protein HPP92_013173 [Vanilla planifolia]